MPKVQYIERTFQPESLKLILVSNEIIEDYQAQGFTLTLRQLYYQLVARDIIANRQSEYKRLGSIVNDARLAGMIDWLSIEDRTRSLRSLAHWTDPTEIISACGHQFRMNLWEGQMYRPEVWIEKDALVGVIEGVCNELDVPFFSCRGYTSQSEMWVAAGRLKEYGRAKQIPIVFHFGDHDPSGKDMTRDIIDRLKVFMGGVRLERLALNMDQIEQYDPPPNPAKTTDSRYAGYIAEFGAESWELDALEPAVIANLIRAAIEPLRDMAIWRRKETEIGQHREMLLLAANKWAEVVKHLRNGKA